MPFGGTNTHHTTPDVVGRVCRVSHLVGVRRYAHSAHTVRARCNDIPRDCDALKRWHAVNGEGGVHSSLNAVAVQRTGASQGPRTPGGGGAAVIPVIMRHQRSGGGEGSPWMGPCPWGGPP